MSSNQPKQPDISGLFNDLMKNLPKQVSNGKPVWWQTYSYPDMPYVYPDQLINYTKVASFFQALLHGGCVYDYSHHGTFTGTIDELVSSLERIGCKLVYKVFPVDKKRETEMFFNMESGALFVSHQELKPPKFDICCVTTETKQLEKVKELFVNFTVEDDKRNNVYMINTAEHSFDLLNLGSLSTPLNKDNYASEVLKDFDYVSGQFNNEKPAGRLLILNGPPGTGKTFFIRGLLDTLKSGTFILLPPDMIAELSKPQLIKTITDAAKNKFSKGPLNIIIEDADEALLQRGSDNMGVITAVLNMADGLLGSVLDVRIIATTNAKKLEMEPAILRPGRLCKLINLEKLEVEQANRLLASLAQGKDFNPFAKSVTLAEVYQAASLL